MPDRKGLEELGRREGFLVDREIVAAIAKRQMITNSSANSAKYACYELHIGTDIEQLVTCDMERSETESYVGKKTSPEGTFVINPMETFVVNATEELNVPADVFAIAIPVGNIYRLGLCPETTFADPGYSGKFYVTICNYSSRVVTLKVGDPLARLFFFKLASRPDLIHESKPRKLELTASRVPRPSEESMVNIDPIGLIDEVMKNVNPPHYQHAFLTRKIALDHRDEIDKSLRTLFVDNAKLTFIVYFYGFIALSFALYYGVFLIQKSFPQFLAGVFEHIASVAIISAITFLVITPLRKQLLRARGVFKDK